MDKVTSLQDRARAIASEGWNPFNALGGSGDFFVLHWILVEGNRSIYTYVVLVSIPPI